MLAADVVQWLVEHLGIEQERLVFAAESIVEIAGRGRVDDRILATDIEPLIGWSQARPSWNWSPWEALPGIDVRTLMIVGELEDPDDLMGQAAALMPAATRVRIPRREHINAFLASDLALPIVREFLLP